MSRTEKESEIELSQVLESFDSNHIFYTPQQHPILKMLFENASKTSNGKRGIPDRILFDGSTLVIIECKAKTLRLGLLDVIFYMNNLVKNDYIIFGVAFVSKHEYIIINSKQVELHEILCPQTFCLKNASPIVKTVMDNRIHNIHNYIRDNTKISDEDKGFFIAIILIFLKKTSARFLIDSYQSKHFVYDLLKDSLLEYDIDPSPFEFFKTDNNNTHFINIINLVREVLDNNYHTDILNLFYSEFVRYNNSDSKSLGIVLTPPHIVRLMVHICQINSDDIVLDFCSGTGSFLLESLKYNPSKLIGCEYQTKLFTLLKCNMIIRNVPLTKYSLFKGNCFDHQFQATKCIINPPYGMSDKKETDFILKQLESVSENGLACAIIPLSKLSSTSSNRKIKSKILSMGIIECIIRCNSNLFKPNASVHCGIILIRRHTNPPPQTSIQLLVYEDDGREMEVHYGFVYKDTFESNYANLLSQFNSKVGIYPFEVNSDWGFQDLDSKMYSTEWNLNEYRIRQLELDYNTKLQQEIDIINKTPSKTYARSKIFKLTDLFNIEHGRKIIKDSNIGGAYPLISSSEKNNGICGYTTDAPYENCLTIADMGCCFYQPTRFNATCHVSILTLKTPREDTSFYEFVSSILNSIKSNYSFYRARTTTRIKAEVIVLPVTESDEIDFEFIRTQINNK